MLQASAEDFVEFTETQFSTTHFVNDDEGQPQARTQAGLMFLSMDSIGKSETETWKGYCGANFCGAPYHCVIVNTKLGRML
jgi:hypothetical protein